MLTLMNLSQRLFGFTIFSALTKKSRRLSRNTLSFVRTCAPCVPRSETRRPREIGAKSRCVAKRVFTRFLCESVLNRLKMVKKNFVTRAFTRNMKSQLLDCVSCSNQGNLSVSVNLTNGNFEIKNNTMNLYSFSKEIEIYLNVCDTIIKQHLNAVKELESDLPF